jgi:hypothetical protein
VVDNETVACVTPAGTAGETVDVAVTSHGVTEIEENAFTYNDLPPAPSITSISPDTGLTTGGETVIITGGNFTDITTVTFGAETANCIMDNTTQLTCITPPYPTPTTVDVIVTTAYGSSDTMTFTYEEPTISLSVGGKNTIALTGLIGMLWTDYLTANVKTNNPTGYSLRISASEPRLTCKLVKDGEEEHYYINALSNAGTGDMIDNFWGYAVGTPDSWAGVTNTLEEIDSYGFATDPDNGRDTVIWFGTQVNMSQRACEYGGEVVITAVVN